MASSTRPEARGRDPALRVDIVHESERVRITRVYLPGRTIIRKEPLGPDADRRHRHEHRILERLRGVEGVAQLVESPRFLGSIVVADAGGESLADLPKPLDVEALIRIAVRLAKAVAGMHERSVMHRDISPANVVTSDDGSPCLVDFTLATSWGEIRPEFMPQSEIMGDLAYLAPEQTGRTGRPVDQRADLYALGATLYELATGEPPFGSGDPLQLTHDHLAKVPVAPAATNPAVPWVLSEIVMHLLEKEPDNRYQTAEGVIHDLEQLQVRSTPTGTYELRIGERDVPMRLVPPSRLVGRDTELAALHAAFEAALEGRCRGVLVSGAPGVGKTALADELRPLVTTRNGWFVAGKFDQYRRDLESDAVHQAFRALGRLLLAEPEEELAQIRRRILDSLGANARQAAAVVPEFAAVLQVTPEPGDPLTAKPRAQYNAVVTLRAVASRNRPVVVFVDDLQWAPDTPLGVVDVVLGSEPIDGLLLVGAYRNDDVNAARPLAALLSRWREQVGVKHQQLENLPVWDLMKMLAEMLHMDPSSAAGLAEAVYERTLGNPYETVELLNALRRDGMLSATAAGWRWDEAAVRARLGRSEVAGLLAAWVETMPRATREMVEAMACLGGRVDLTLIQAAIGEPAAVVDQSLAPVRDDGMLFVEPGAQEAVRFTHDRVREVILDGLDLRRRRAMQLAMARRLAAVPDWFVVAAEQYLPVVDLLVDPAERRVVAGLLRRTAEQAALIGEYARVDRLLASALRLIESGDTEALIAARTARHAALFSLGRLDEADEEYRVIDGLCRTATEQAQATCMQVRSLTHRNRFTEAIGLGIDLLRKLGIIVPAPDRRAGELDSQFEHLYRWLAETDAADDLGRPEISDATLLAATAAIDAILPPAYFGADLITLGWLGLEAVRIWLEHGPGRTLLSPASHAALAAQGLRNEYAAGYRTLRRILAFGEARGYEPDTSRVRFLFSLFSCWFEPIERGVDQGRRAREGLIAGGDLANAGYTYSVNVSSLVDCAPSLDAFAAELDGGLAFARRTGSEPLAEMLDSHRWLVNVLRSESATAASEAGPVEAYGVSPQTFLKAHTTRAVAAAIFGDLDALSLHTAATLHLHAGLGDPSGDGGDTVERGGPPQGADHEHHGAPGHVVRPAVVGSYPSAVDRVLRGLALAGQVRARESDDLDDLLFELDDVMRWLAGRAADAPDNFLHLLRLLEAERAWAVGDFQAAAVGFDSARREVARRRRPWHGALIAEHAARFYLAQGIEQVGSDLLAQARAEYLAWGATAKVAQLDWAYPVLQPQQDPAAAHSGVQPEELADRRSPVTTGTIDLLGILSASQALSSETSIDRLQVRVTDVLSGMTGASGVHLLLWSEERQDWFAPPSGDSGTPVSGAGHETQVPGSVLRYVQRMREPLVVADAPRDDRFARDPYFSGVDCCSLLAVPVLSRGRLGAVLLLENRLIRGAFTAERLDAVKLIGGQLAVSLDNAQVYADFRRVADEQLALRNVATLVARGVAPEDVLAAVAEEAGRLVSADIAMIGRYAAGASVTATAVWRRDGNGDPVPLSTDVPPGGENIMSLVFSSGQPARIEAHPTASGELANSSRASGIGSALGVPITVEGRVWGVMMVSLRHERQWPSDTEDRLAKFTELAATAIANSHAHEELAASRARIVTASDHVRRQIERDVHDGAQQRLVSLGLQLRATQASVPTELSALRASLDRAVGDLGDAVDELREIARGIHPTILSTRGLRPALKALARRAPIPVGLTVGELERLPEHIEITAYYVFAEGLTNAAKHANASAITASAQLDPAKNLLRIEIRDDGAGGADSARGTGLLGLADRVQALGGRISLDSPEGSGTTLHVELPVVPTLGASR